MIHGLNMQNGFQGNLQNLYHNLFIFINVLVFTDMYCTIVSFYLMYRFTLSFGFIAYMSKSSEVCRWV